MARAMLVHRPRNGDCLLKRLLTFLVSCSTLAVDDASFNWPSGCTGDTSYQTHYQSSCPCTTTGTFFVPTGVTSIPASAFIWCIGITSVTGMADVTTIAESAFAYSGLESIQWPAGVTEVPQHAFDEAVKLRKITGLDAVINVGGWAFFGINDLPHVYLPANCAVGSKAFVGSGGHTVGEHSFYGTHTLPLSPPPHPPTSPAPAPSPPTTTTSPPSRPPKSSDSPRLEVVLPIAASCFSLAIAAAIVAVIAHRRSRSRAFVRQLGPGAEKGRPIVESHPVVAPDGDVSLATKTAP